MHAVKRPALGGPSVGDATPLSPCGGNSICVDVCSLGDMEATVTGILPLQELAP